MASFKMRNSRTKKYNSDGSRIYNTFNSTGLVNKYENHNARFDSRNKGRELDLVDSNGNKLNNCSQKHKVFKSLFRGHNPNKRHFRDHFGANFVFQLQAW